MNEFCRPSNLWESFKQGQPEAFRYFFRLHNCRIYYYLLRLLRDQRQARESTQHTFIVLFNNREQLLEEEYVLRRLYLYARIGFLLRLKGKRSAVDLQQELKYYIGAEIEIMDDPDIAQNETLIDLQVVLQKLPPAKREIAELYFFQEFSVKAIARQLGFEEQIIRESISQCLKRLAEELSGDDNDANKKNFSVVRA